jgi:hypothetical protein
MLNDRLSFLGIKWPATANAEKIVTDGGNLPIKVKTSRLPEAFRKKFQLGDYRIDESDGDIRIKDFDMDFESREKIVNAIGDERRFFNFHGKKEGVRDFWATYAKNNPGRTVVYLEVGSHTYFFQELFERLIVVDYKNIKQDRRNGYRSPFGRFSETRTMMCCIGDDRNLQDALRNDSELSEAFRAGRVKIFIYHKAVKSLTSLYFDRHDDDVMAIDMKRAFFARSKDTGFWAATGATGAFIGSTAIGAIPILGTAVECATVFAVSIAAYKIYQLLCPMCIRKKINTFVSKKIDDRASKLGTTLQIFGTLLPKNTSAPINRKKSLS